MLAAAGWRIFDHAITPLSLSRTSDTTSLVLHDVQVGGEISCCQSTIQPRTGDPCCIMDSHDQYQGEWAHTHIGAGTPMFEPVAAPKWPAIYKQLVERMVRRWPGTLIHMHRCNGPGSHVITWSIRLIRRLTQAQESMAWLSHMEVICRDDCWGKQFRTSAAGTSTNMHRLLSY